MTEDESAPYVHRISVVIPVYQGERTLRAVIAEVAPLTEGFVTALGVHARVDEVVLAYDRGPDRSDRVIRGLAEEHAWIKPVWLSRNFGQHAATLAGMASSGGEWIVTLDEDGQHDPADMANLLDAAVTERADLVYAAPVNRPPHGFVRNTASKASKRVLETLFRGGRATSFNSYRLVLGEIGRSVAAYAGTGVYLDVALGWVAARITTAPVTLREEGDRRSGYSYTRLLGHFWRMVLTSGTRGLRLVTATGVVFFIGGVVFALYLVIARFVAGDIPEGWTSQMVLTALGTGVILVSLGIIAEYLGVAVSTALGKPAYLIVRDPGAGPLGRGEPPELRTTDRP
ncbi:MAG: glycosyltransferase [Microbacterium sp.]|uniref:glycosyltransferase n=1 Tax=Microbacterium sp. TaxID=51671 RepID=UPI001AC7430A|nr:glycosyltransferase [Microbacterium sp.]MBN9186695.1 glycosyltransferase [Microbacterium sp.]MBN9190706.1 glycosyltransferase [Microbacterium sp.]MBN9192814.1 glycosyltransferase [Microbacterium sp.]MBN9195004.1 glycosyltransferase [Microbacterium sp.]